MNLITLKDINKNFFDAGIKSTILENINLNIEKNKIISIVGTSGSGKTTLLNIITGIEDYCSGEIVRSDGTTINYVTQHPHFIDELSVRDNLIFASLKNKEHIDIDKHCSYFQCEHLLNKKPQHLSGGERQRINIIRSLLTRPQVLVLDEPTASLDYTNKIKVAELLNTINEKENLSIILVTHDREILAHIEKSSIYELKNKTLSKIQSFLNTSEESIAL